MTAFEHYLEHDAGAVFDGGIVRGFGEGENDPTGDAKCPLLSRGIVRFSGEDARSFINAQFTTNCLELSPSLAQLSAWCDPKGRVLYLFVLFTDGKDFFASLAQKDIDPLVRRLRMYVLRAAVEVDDVTAAYRQIGLIGDGNIEAGAAPWSVSQRASATAIRFGPGAPRTLLIVPAEDVVACWQALPQTPAGEPAWQASVIESGIPSIDSAGNGEYLPQQLNLDQLNAVSFAKGCYPGQEIIARLKYRGEVKKRLVAASCANTGVIAAGDAIRSPAGDARTVGRVLDAVAFGRGTQLLSGVVDVDADWTGLVVEGHEGGELQRIELPYPND